MGDDRHDLVARADGLARLTIEAGVVDRERRQPGEVAHEGEVRLFEGATGRPRDQNEGAHRPPACLERDHHRGAQLELLDEPPELRLVAEHPPRQALRDLAQQQRLPGPQHVADEAARVAGPGAVRARQLGQQRFLLRIDACDGEASDFLAFGDVEDTQVRERGHGKPGHALERFLVVQGGGEGLAGGGDEA